MMSKGINKVRKSIMRRNKLRKIRSKQASVEQVQSIFPQDEEKHGYMPHVENIHFESQTKNIFRSNVAIKGLLAALLFFISTFLLKTNTDMLSQPKSWLRQALTVEFPFARMHHWYEQTFGSPLSFNQSETTNTDDHSLDLPVMVNVTESFQVNGSGIKIAPEEKGHVSAWNEGIVIFTGNNRETKKTVTIQHADDSKTTYGYLSNIDVHLYQYVSPGQRLGTFQPTEENETVYFSLEKNNEFLDPVQVMQVNDQS